MITRPSFPSRSALVTFFSTWWLRLREDSALTRYAAFCLFGSVCALASSSYTSSTSYPRLFVDLASHFVWGYLGLALVIVLVAKGARTRLLAGVAALLAASTLVLAYRATPSLQEPSSAVLLRVLSANVFVHNQSTEKLVALLADRKPDVVVILEVSPAWAKVLETLPDYPYRKVIARKDSFGIALLSKHPLIFTSGPDLAGVDRPPSIAATMTWQGVDIDLVAVHPLPPMGKHAYTELQTVLARHAVRLGASGRPGIMAGDFNATPWSTGLTVVQAAGMTRVSSLAPTWPANLGVPAVIPIDHIVTTSHWTLAENRRGPSIGSDHFPVEATIFLTSHKK